MTIVSLLADGWQVFTHYYLEVSVFFICAFGFGRLITWSTSKFSDLFDTKDYLFLTGIGLLYIPIPVFFTAFFNRPIAINRIIGYLILGVSIYLIISRFFYSLQKKKIMAGLGLALLVFLLIICRVAFLKNTEFPSYSDSVIHFDIVRSFLFPTSEPHSYYSIRDIGHIYYHYGFHLLTGWLISIFNLPIQKGILLIGQLLLVVSSLTIFSFVKSFTNSYKAAIFASIIAAVGFQMPSFAVNWGKYPAIAGIALFPITFKVILNYVPKRKYWLGSVLVLLSIILCNILFHSRILICVISASLCWLVKRLLDRDPSSRRITYICYALGLITFGLLFFEDIGIKDYFLAQNYMAIIGLLLIPFSIHYFPKLSAIVFLFLITELLFAYLPFLIHFNTSTTELIDNTFIIMVSYIPFSIIMATGISGLLKLFSSHNSIIATVLLCLLIIFKIDIPNIFYPHPCCNYLRQEELDSIIWLSNNVSKNNPIIISGQPMRDYIMPVDGGAWINILTKRTVERFPSDYPWDTTLGHANACKLNSAIVFAGRNSNSFSKEYFENADWYLTIYLKDSIRIYKIIGCN